jgi:hypothetical protein
MKTRKDNLFFYSGIALIILTMGLSFFLDIKIAMIIGASLGLAFFYLAYKEEIGQELIIAFLIALFWTSYYVYQYTTNNIMIGRINLFPLVLWTAGLVFIREIYERLRKPNKFLKITVIYIISMFLAEYIGYYLLNIRLNSNFHDLLNLGIMHAPMFMQIFYLTIGPIYIIITDYLNVK